MTFTHTSKFPNLILCSFKPNKLNLSSPKPRIIPPTDRLIDFGKYKGKMLGALPSTYLKWVSKNLRAGDFEHWAELADRVLQDKVYQDRLEWEFLDKVLNGSNGDDDDGAVSQLLEISERFGWDNEDKVGWSRVNFELLGTSRGGRIPRKVSPSGFKQVEELDLDNEEKVRVLSQPEMRRKERRERAKLKKEADRKREKLGIVLKTKDKIVNGMENLSEIIDEEEDAVEIINNPFPGRQALFKKVLNY
ncbi:uncharacterized protein LOC107260837 [Ricinus communis]|uniref:uncharacterized protein LOC107260837 n=1 Tax=Ricinus communis TaxID=3988 RepID=UPI0007726F7D|nr:uncharacterized protein LOC107260837 [Ricinus communis]|eukprot:XP_015571164.1 uncharacterized protein LOC107260837 [Ricinus communis]